PSAHQRRRDGRLERRWLRSADAVACVSGPVAHDLRQRLGIEPQLVPNGWDPDLIEPDEAGGDAAGILDPDRVSLVYTGRFGSYWRDPAPPVRALGELGRTDGPPAPTPHLGVAGPLHTAQADAVLP